MKCLKITFLSSTVWIRYRVTGNDRTFSCTGYRKEKRETTVFRVQIVIFRGKKNIGGYPRNLSRSIGEDNTLKLIVLDNAQHRPNDSLILMVFEYMFSKRTFYKKKKPFNKTIQSIKNNYF